MNGANELPNRFGHILWFVHLHLETACKVRSGKKDRENVYEVEGKTRPMFVIDCVNGRAKNSLVYRVLPITKSGLKEDGTVKRGFLDTQEFLTPGVRSFVELSPREYPQNLLAPESLRDPSPFVANRHIANAIMTEFRCHIQKIPNTTESWVG